MATSPELERLEHETEEARTRLAHTIERLTSPETTQAVKKELTDYAQGVKDSILSGGRNRADNLKQRALANPLGLALIGAGIGWHFYKKPPITTLLVGAGIATLMSGNSGPRRLNAGAYRDPYDREQPRGYVPGGVAGYGYPVEESPPGTTLADRASAAASQASVTARDLSERARGAAHEASEMVSSTVESATTSLSQAAESVRTAAAAATDSAASTVSGIRTAASDMLERSTSFASHAAEEARQRASRLAEEAPKNPWLLGALGLAVGTALAYSLRPTDWDDGFRGGGRRTDRGARHTEPEGRRAPRRRTTRASGTASGERFGGATRRAGDMAEEAASSVADMASSVGGAAGRALGAAGDAVSSSAASVYEAAASTYRSAADMAYSATRQAPRTAARMQRQVAEMGESYPLLLGAISLAIGAAVGGSLRLSERERRVMGPLSDQLRQKVLEAADEQFDHAKEAAEHFAERLRTQFGHEDQPEDASSDFETVIGGGPPAVEREGARFQATRPGSNGGDRAT